MNFFEQKKQDYPYFGFELCWRDIHAFLKHKKRGKPGKPKYIFYKSNSCKYRVILHESNLRLLHLINNYPQFSATSKNAELTKSTSLCLRSTFQFYCIHQLILFHRIGKKPSAKIDFLRTKRAPYIRNNEMQIFSNGKKKSSKHYHLRSSFSENLISSSREKRDRFPQMSSCWVFIFENIQYLLFAELHNVYHVRNFGLQSF